MCWTTWKNLSQRSKNLLNSETHLGISGLWTRNCKCRQVPFSPWWLWTSDGVCARWAFSHLLCPPMLPYTLRSRFYYVQSRDFSVVPKLCDNVKMLRNLNVARKTGENSCPPWTLCPDVNSFWPLPPTCAPERQSILYSNRLRGYKGPSWYSNWKACPDLRKASYVIP